MLARLLAHSELSDEGGDDGAIQLGHRLRQNILVMPDRAYEILEDWGNRNGLAFSGVLEG